MTGFFWKGTSGRTCFFWTGTPERTCLCWKGGNCRDCGLTLWFSGRSLGGTGPVLTLPANVVGLVTAGDGPARRLDRDCGMIDACCFAFSIRYDAVGCDPVCSSFPLSSTVSVGMALSSCLGREPPKEAATAAVGVPGVVPVAASAAVRVVLPLHQRPAPAGW